MKSVVNCALVVALFGGCDDEETDKPEVKVLKAQCRDVLKHIVAVSPQTEGRDTQAIAAALPIEDVDGCVASEPEIRTCMMTASDIPAVRRCIPSNEVLACMQAAAKAKAAAYDKAGAPGDRGKEFDDKPYDRIRAKCWSGDANAVHELGSIKTI